MISRCSLVLCCDLNCRRGAYAQNREALTDSFVPRLLHLFLVWNVFHKCKVSFDVIWCLLVYYDINNINFCIYNLVRHMLILISKDSTTLINKKLKKSIFFLELFSVGPAMNLR